MSEIKPVGYISETAMKQILSGGYEGVSLRAEKGSSDFQSAWGNDIPLYTAGQLAEAVAAERERCAKVCEELEYSYAQKSLHHPASSRFMNGMSQSAQNCAEAIRSAAK